jgi:hypothetical protein
LIKLKLWEKIMFFYLKILIQVELKHWYSGPDSSCNNFKWFAIIHFKYQVLKLRNKITVYLNDINQNHLN